MKYSITRIYKNSQERRNHNRIFSYKFKMAKVLLNAKQKKLQNKTNQQKHKVSRYIATSKIVKKHQCFTGNLSKTAFLRFFEVKSKRYIIDAKKS